MKITCWVFLCVWFVVSFTGCASTPLEAKRQQTLDCTKDLMEHDGSALDSFEVCRQVYRLRRINE